MSAVSSEGGGNNQDFDLNIAPIIDCFTVLIAYMLVSASFLTLGVFDVGVAVSGQAATPDEAPPPEPPMALVVQIFDSGLVRLDLTGGAQNLNLKIPISGKPLQRDLASLKTQLDGFKEKYAKLSDVSVI